MMLFLNSAKRKSEGRGEGLHNVIYPWKIEII